MPTFNVAWRTRAGAAPRSEVVWRAARRAAPAGSSVPDWIVLASELPAPGVSKQALPPGLPSPALEPSLTLELDQISLTLTPEAISSAVLHFARLADGTVRPLPSRPGPMKFTPGDTYVAVSPGARRVAEGPAIARFLHVRDEFNAERLAQWLLDHLAERAGTDGFPEVVTVLVVEAR